MGRESKLPAPGPARSVTRCPGRSSRGGEPDLGAGAPGLAGRESGRRGLSDEGTATFSSTARRRLMRPVRNLLTQPREVPGLPNRYRIRDGDTERYLTCLDAPEIRVRIQRGGSVSASSARKAPEGTIFLDGAAQAGPFLDRERRVFNLDHHEGCVRAFTLATCEQALTLVLRGLDLREKSWTVLANEPDLDTLLAIWVLLNSAHLERGSEVLAAAAPVVRLEGTIDAHGSDLTELSGLSEQRRREVESLLDQLMEPEQTAKKEGIWDGMDPLQYIARQLYALDRELFPPGHFSELAHVEEEARANLSEERVVIACRSERGIYDLEADLKKLYGKRLGVIILDKGEGAFTLRLVDAFLPQTLAVVYDRLNLADPAVGAADPSNRWGGAGDIGGSPRRTGSKLSVQEVTDLVAAAFRKRRPLERTAGVLAGVVVGALALSGLGVDRLLQSGAAVPARLEAATLLVATSSMVWLVLGRRRRRLHGLVPPHGIRWTWTLLAALPAALVGGAWWAHAPSDSGGSWPLALAVTALLASGAELAFRGAVHGTVGRFFQVVYPPRAWVLSPPVVVSCALYVAASLLFELGSPIPVVANALPGAEWSLIAAGALIFGLAAGLARDRSGSVVAPLALHLLGSGTALACTALF